MSKAGMNVSAQAISTNWIVKCFVMTPYELVVCRLQRFWRRRMARMRYQTVMMGHKAAMRELGKLVELSHRHIMRVQEGRCQALTNRVNMFGCEISARELRKYRAARMLQCVARCHLAKRWRRMLVPAAVKIQKTYRGLLGRRKAKWQRVIKRLKAEEAQTLSWLRQKYVGDAVQDAELAVLARYTKLEQAMSSARSDIVDREKRAEQLFKVEARRLQERVRRGTGLGPWLPQSGSVSGKKYYCHTETGEVVLIAL